MYSGSVIIDGEVSRVLKTDGAFINCFRFCNLFKNTQNKMFEIKNVLHISMSF